MSVMHLLLLLLTVPYVMSLNLMNRRMYRGDPGGIGIQGAQGIHLNQGAPKNEREAPFLNRNIWQLKGMTQTGPLSPKP